MNTHRIIGGLCMAAGVIAFMMYSCSSGGSGGAASGAVALYLTDDIADYRQVTATVTKVQLRHTGSGAACDVQTDPMTVDITNLDGVMQLTGFTACPADQYNRIHLEFEKSVELTNPTGTVSSCVFTSYLDDQGRPNTLTCTTDSCSMDITGAVNVLANAVERLALDFDLKNFSVSGFGTPSCEVTMKVSPIHASGMGQGIRSEAITGFVSNLDAANDAFTLTHGRTSFSILYSGITDTQQPGLDTLLQRAQDDRLRARVAASGIDLSALTVSASQVFVKVEGTVDTGSLDTVARTFSVVYSSGTTTKSLGVDYGAALVEGSLAEGGWVEVKLDGYLPSGLFRAWKVEDEAEGTMTED